MFYLLIPGIGAFLARKRWREFRKNLLAAVKAPLYDFHKFRSHEAEGYAGVYKFFGNLEAIQEKNEVWLRKGNFTVSVDMSNVKIYLIPAFAHPENSNSFFEDNRDIIMDETPQAISWERFYSLSQRTEVMICGPVAIEKGKAIFRSLPENKIIFLIYDGKAQSLLRRGVWAGRQRNEFWNIFTPVSLVAGSFALFIYAYYLYSIPPAGYAARVSLALSLVPVMPLFPPGAVLFFAYRYFWTRGRYLRAERDLLKLPLQFFRENDLDRESFCVDAGDGVEYCYRKIYGSENAFNICRSEETLIRKPSLAGKMREKGSLFYYFYPRGESLSDPLLEKVIISGDPEKFSSRCGKKSRLFEYMAVTVFTAGVVCNFILTVLFIASVGR